ncbi:hypothetical protein OS493_006829 [Desmophyllum pertusum]|uniref:Uncharacterized protein n=1 Tax=Desmophyllum pertusum TaxID=174260 RepID=A0A9W9ZSR2_9CNID|nr:hypothetical protein OS493_006829 [Desmophyllum pertusum]
MANNGVVLFGMSPGNPYFKSRVIEDYVDYLGKENRRIIVVVPQQPAEHTYRALGSKDAVKRAKKILVSSSRIVGELLKRWESQRKWPEIFTSKSTAKVLGKDTASSDESESETTDSELEDDENIQEGVYYLLKELAFIISSKEIFRTDNVAVIYHRQLACVREVC